METTATPSLEPEPGNASRTRAWSARIGYATVLAVATIVVESLAVHLFTPDWSAIQYFEAIDKTTGVFTYVFALLVAPLLETLLMAWFILLMLERVRAPLAMALSGVIWGGIHAIGSPSRWVVGFSFVLYSYAFIARRRRSPDDGFSVVAIAHFIHNLFILTLATGAGVITWKL